MYCSVRVLKTLLFQNVEDVFVLLCQDSYLLLGREALNQVAPLALVDLPITLRFFLMLVFISIRYDDLLALCGHFLKLFLILVVGLLLPQTLLSRAI